jgi:MFS transporter, PCFT/HCP family, solute carrier family 46 (folate transporter), member 1
LLQKHTSEKNSNMSNIVNSLVSTLRTFTIEPVIFFFILGNYILQGSQVPTNILIFKICRYELNYTQEICDNLGEDRYADIEDQVQKKTNSFQMTAQWLSNVPGIIFAIYAGPLSDQFGRKPLMMLPIIGYFISAIGGIINYAFLESLPLEFFFVDSIPYFFGGLIVYYLGQYGYGASVTEPDERAHRIARLDASEYIATLIGTLLSPIISEHVGYYGNYGLFAGLALTAIGYLQLFVKEPVDRKRIEEEAANSENSPKQFGVLYTFLVQPLIDMKELICKKRTTLLWFLIVIQLLIYCTYIFVLNAYTSLLYLFMLIQFDGFTATQFSYFSVTMNVCSIFFLLFIMPILGGKFKLSDAFLLTLISVIETLGYILSPFTSNLKVFYIYQFLCTIGNCKFPLGRSLISKYCEPDEVGKMYSIQSIVIALAFMASNPIVRHLYDKTLENFPGAYLLLNASLLVLSGFGNFFIFVKEDQMKVKEESAKSNSEAN